jgi:L-ascorbate metabolism protein UlaG (beta-lactamase superfamily)
MKLKFFKMLNFFKYFLLLLFMSILSSCLFFKESSYYKGPKSNHFDGKKFFNPSDDLTQKKDFLSYYKSRKEYEKKFGKTDWKSYNINLKTYKPLEKNNNNKFSITYVGHSTFLIQFNNLNILTDPIWSNRASPFSFIGPKRVKNPGIKFDDLPKIDIVLISHSHYDHLDIPTIKKLKKHSNPQIYAGLGVCHYLNIIKKLNLECYEMDWHDNKIINDDLTIHFLPAKHWSKRYLYGSNASLWGAFALEAKIGNIYFAGDTGYENHFAEAGLKFKKFKIALLPIGAYKPQEFMSKYHISPKEALMAHKELNAEFSIAMHYETFQLASDKFEDPANEIRKFQKENNINNKFLLMEVAENKEF